MLAWGAACCERSPDRQLRLFYLQPVSGAPPPHPCRLCFPQRCNCGRGVGRSRTSPPRWDPLLTRPSGARPIRCAVRKFQARLQALARTHNLLTRHSWESADVTEIVRDQTYEGVEEFDIFGYDLSQSWTRSETTRSDDAECSLFTHRNNSSSVLLHQFSSAFSRAESLQVEPSRRSAAALD